MRYSLSLISAAVCLCSTASAQSGAFVTRLGRDTIAFERFTEPGRTWKGPPCRRCLGSGLPTMS